MSAGFLGFIFLLAISGPRARAGQWNSQCQAAAQAAASACNATAGSVNAADGARSAADAATSKGQGDNIYGGTQAGNIAAHNSDLQKAIPACQTDKQKCDQVCDQAKQQAQPHASNPQDPLYSQAVQDIAQIPQTKASQCDAPIQNTTQQMQAGQMPLPGQQQQAGNTQDASAGQQGTAQTQLDCSTASSISDPNCASYFVQQCSGSMSGANCIAFTNQYCGIGSTSAGAPAPGAGTSFCQQALAGGPCAAGGACGTAGTFTNAKSPSNSGTPATSYMSQSVNSAPAAASSAPVSHTANTTGNGGGGGFGAMSALAGGATANKLLKKVKAANGLPNIHFGSGGGGGGGGLDGGSGGAGSSALGDADLLPPALMALKHAEPQSIKRSVASTAPAPGVAMAYGPSLFDISSHVYAQMCTQGRLHHCATP